jgi:hypothetical protein
MSIQQQVVGVNLSGAPGTDAEEVAEATLQLRRELLELDVDAVDVARSGEAPAGSRGVDVTALGALVVTLGQSPVLGSIVDTVRSWLTRSGAGTIKLELGGDVLELTGVSSEEQRRLTDEWLRRHQGPAG